MCVCVCVCVCVTGRQAKHAPSTTHTHTQTQTKAPPSLYHSKMPYYTDAANTVLTPTAAASCCSSAPSQTPLYLLRRCCFDQCCLTQATAQRSRTETGRQPARVSPQAWFGVELEQSHTHTQHTHTLRKSARGWGLYIPQLLQCAVALQCLCNRRCPSIANAVVDQAVAAVAVSKVKRKAKRDHSQRITAAY